MMAPCARPASLTRASAPLSTRNWSTWRETSARVNCPSGSFGCSGKRNGRGFLASKRDFHSSSGRRIGGGFMSSATSTCFPTNTIAPRTLSFTEFKYVSSSACVGCFGSAGFAAAGIGGAAHFGSGGGGAPPRKLKPPPVGGAQPRGDPPTTFADRIPLWRPVPLKARSLTFPRSARSRFGQQTSTQLCRGSSPDSSEVFSSHREPLDNIRWGFAGGNASKRKVPYLIFWSSDNAWLMLFNVWNPSLTTVVLILSFVTATGFSNMAGPHFLTSLPMSSPCAAYTFRTLITSPLDA